MKIVCLFYEGMTALHMVGPHEVLFHVPGAKVQHVAKNRGLVHTESGLTFTAEYSLQEVSHADVLLIP